MLPRESQMRASAPRPAILPLVLGILLAALGSGCSDGVTGTGHGRADVEAARSTPDEGLPKLQEGGAATDFEWPEGSDHPRVHIEVAGAAGPGTIEIELMPELAPETVRQFLAWVREDFYAGTTFHRVIDGFMIQGGDPNTRDRVPDNDGRGGPGFTLEDEFTGAPFVRGVVAMANRGHPDSAGSQFFIMHSDRRELDGRYTTIGRVRSGMDQVDAIVGVDTDEVGRWGPQDRPVEDVVMVRLSISEEHVVSKTDSKDAGKWGETTSEVSGKAPEDFAPPAAPTPQI